MSQFCDVSLVAPDGISTNPSANHLFVGDDVHREPFSPETIFFVHMTVFDWIGLSSCQDLPNVGGRYLNTKGGEIHESIPTISMGAMQLHQVGDGITGFGSNN
jgi:hypothetical protein